MAAGAGVVESLRVLRYSAARSDRYRAIVDFEWREISGEQCGFRCAVPVEGLGIGVFKATGWGVLMLVSDPELRADVVIDGRGYALPILDGDALEAEDGFLNTLA